MSIFRSGLRVRILYSVTFSDLAGEEGTIIKETHFADVDGGRAGNTYWEVAPDCWQLGKGPVYDGAILESFSPAEIQLSPLQPDGYAVSTWDKCIWRPKPTKRRTPTRTKRPQQEGSPA